MKYNIALVIGRFQPFHKGHLFLVKKALEKADKIIFGIGSANIQDEYNPLNFQQRKQMLEIMIKAEEIEARVMKIVPLDDFYDNEKWLNNVKKQVGKFDIVIGNSEWVNKILEKAGYKVWRLGYYNKRLYEGWKVRRLIGLGKNIKTRVSKYLHTYIMSNVKTQMSNEYQNSNNKTQSNSKFLILNSRFSHCILGGTFDHFHLGHEKFIETAINQSARITIGLATEKLYKHKLLSQSIENYLTREKNITDFLKKKKYFDRVKIIPLDDIYGSGDKEEKIDAIFVTEETYKGALAINTKRRDMGWPMLKIIKVPMIKAKDGKNISSERIRLGEINREGFIYLEIFKRTLILYEKLRKELRKPIGEVIQNSKFRIQNYSKKESIMIIAVGDIIVNSLMEKGLIPDIAVIDFKNRRKSINNKFQIPNSKLQTNPKFQITNNKQKHSLEHLEFENSNLFGAWNLELGIFNSHGTLNKRAVEVLKSQITKYLNTNEKQLLVIEGEEDLLALPAIILSPINSLVLYGQYDLGVVVVKVTVEIKEKVRKLLLKFI